jgi:hypothetical protein
MKDPERLKRQLLSTPRDSEIDKRKKIFDALNRFIQARHGFMTSIPGDVEMRFDALPESQLPQELHALGYTVIPIGETQRILASAITERLEISSSGALVHATENSTKPITTRTHAGIARFLQFELIPPSVSPDQGMPIPN